MSGVGWRAARDSFSLNAVTPPAKEAKVMGKQPSGLFYLKPRPPGPLSQDLVPGIFQMDGAGEIRRWRKIK